MRVEEEGGCEVEGSERRGSERDAAGKGGAWCGLGAE